MNPCGVADFLAWKSESCAEATFIPRNWSATCTASKISTEVCLPTLGISKRLRTSDGSKKSWSFSAASTFAKTSTKDIGHPGASQRRLAITGSVHISSQFSVFQFCKSTDTLGTAAWAFHEVQHMVHGGAQKEAGMLQEAFSVRMVMAGDDPQSRSHAIQTLMEAWCHNAMGGDELWPQISQPMHCTPRIRSFHLQHLDPDCNFPKTWVDTVQEIGQQPSLQCLKETGASQAKHHKLRHHPPVTCD